MFEDSIQKRSLWVVLNTHYPLGVRLEIYTALSFYNIYWISRETETKNILRTSPMTKSDMKFTVTDTHTHTSSNLHPRSTNTITHWLSPQIVKYIKSTKEWFSSQYLQHPNPLIQLQPFLQNLIFLLRTVKFTEQFPANHQNITDHQSPSAFHAFLTCFVKRLPLRFGHLRQVDGSVADDAFFGFGNELFPRRHLPFVQACCAEIVWWGLWFHL